MVTDFLHWTGTDYLFNPGKRLFWGYLLSSLVIVFVYAGLARRPLGDYFNRAIWWHRSARLDYLYFVVISILKTVLILPLVIGVQQVAFFVYRSLENVFGYQAAVIVDTNLLMALYTLSLFVVSDFSRYWLHRLMHSVSWLWEFHKVHHSAEVLTPFTFYRVHPLENLLFGFRYALVSGLVTGIFVYLFGAGLQLWQILGLNVFVLLAHVIGDNLRHSHVDLGYPDWLERYLISPAQHQFHHSYHGTRKNYGGVLAVWDRCFGSLRLSRKDDQYHFGVEAEMGLDSVPRLLFQPLQRILISATSCVGFLNVKNRTEQGIEHVSN